MELLIASVLCLQLHLRVTFAEWIEISKTPAQEVNKSAIKQKGNGIPSYSSLSGENVDEHIKEDNYERTYVNKVFVDESTMEERLDMENTNIKSEEENYPGFMPFIQNIQSTLIRSAHQGIGSKINLLQELKYNLLFNIKEKIGSLWKSPTTREAREYFDTNQDHHLDFPSNEGALMSIGFLTFAVFLIKLVLKLIYALKNKNSTNSNGTPIIVGRRKRDTFDEDAAKILQLIEEYKFA